MMLLSDQVFVRAPRVMKRLIAVIAEEPGFRRLMATDGLRRRWDMALTPEAGGNALFEACTRKLVDEQDRSRRRALRGVMTVNSNRETRKALWSSRCKAGLTMSDALQEAADFRIVSQLRREEIAQLEQGGVEFQLQWLVMTDQYEELLGDRDLYDLAKREFFEGELEVRRRWRRTGTTLVGIEVLTEFLRPQLLAVLFAMGEGEVAAHTALERKYTTRWRGLIESVRGEYHAEGAESLESFALFVAELLSRKLTEWRKSLEPWARLVDRGLELVPGNYLMVRLAVLATASFADGAVGVWDGDGFRATKGLVNRLFFARHKGSDADWWTARVAEVAAETVNQCLAVLLVWGQADVIAKLKPDIERILERLSSRDWDRLWSMTSVVRRATPGRRVAIPEAWFGEIGSLSPRLAVILVGRVAGGEARRSLSRAYLADYSGDDEHIVHRATEIELSGSDKDKVVHWDYVQHLSRRAQQMGTQMMSRVARLRVSQVPEAVAKAVLCESDGHSGQLVATCEEAYATIVAQAAPKISVVAETDGWFTSRD